MADTVAVEAARIPDRDRLLEELIEAGIDARAVGEVCIEVPCDDSADASDDLYLRAEQLVLSIGTAFVPVKHEGVIYIRPPVG